MTRLLLLLSALLLFTKASRYATYDYDLTTPQFSPDGRLLQVEYALNACVRQGSNPILSVGFCDGDDVMLVMATVTSTQTICDNNDAGAAREMNRRAQYRIIEVPLSSIYNQFKSTRRDVSAIKTSTMLVGLSGHLSDATALLQTIYSQLEEEQSVFGWHRLGVTPIGHGTSLQLKTTETTPRLARAVADQCQKHAFGGGLRPIGASLMLCAIDMEIHRPGVAMCKTDPSGGMRSQISSTKDDKLFLPPQVMISGGASKSQSTLNSLIETKLKELHQAGKMSSGKIIRKMLQSTVSSLAEEWWGRQDTVSSISRIEQQVLPQMEVVIVSSKMGNFRLSESDISALLRGCDDGSK